MSYRGFILFADGRVEEVDADGEVYDHEPEPGLFDDLVFAGYPLQGDRDLTRWDGIIDVRIEDDGRVFAYTSGPPPWEHDMGAAGALLRACLKASYDGELP
jgi:hypothetical protein